MTTTFKVTYASGLVTEMTSECETVEAFCNEHFGSAWETAKEHGATVEIVGAGQTDGAPSDDAPKAKGRAKKAAAE